MIINTVQKWHDLSHYTSWAQYYMFKIFHHSGENRA